MFPQCQEGVNHLPREIVGHFRGVRGQTGCNLTFVGGSVEGGWLAWSRVVEGFSSAKEEEGEGVVLFGPGFGCVCEMDLTTTGGVKKPNILPGRRWCV